MTMTASERGGVRGAMGTVVRRGKVQEDHLYSEHKEHDGSPPLVGVKSFLLKEQGGVMVTHVALICFTPEEKVQQIASVNAWQGACNCAGSEQGMSWNTMWPLPPSRMVVMAWPTCSARRGTCVAFSKR